MLMSSIISASEEPITQDGTVQTTLQKIESWASIATDGSWQETKKDFLKFTSIIEQIKYLAENNSFFKDDEDDSDDEEESDNQSEFSNKSGNDVDDEDKPDNIIDMIDPYENEKTTNKQITNIFKSPTK